MKVLVTDDSIVFRSQIKLALQGISGVDSVITAINGRVALDKLEQDKIDLVILDVEMPEMTGIEVVQEIRKRKSKVKILMFSAVTTQGSRATVEALAAGADDFITKPNDPDLNIENAAERIRKKLHDKILQFQESTLEGSELPTEGDSRKDSQNKTMPKSAPMVIEPVIFPPSSRDSFFPSVHLSKFQPEIIVIGCSTGGPAALDGVLRGFAGQTLRIPIVIVQHMPPVFTASLAAHLESVTQIPAREAKTIDPIKPQIYVAPGDYHLTIRIIAQKPHLYLDQGPPRNSVRPAVDSLFESAADVYGDRAMGFVLTGMGYDGAQGATALKRAGAGVMIQDRESSVVFGMPGAVMATGAYDEIGNIEQIGSLLQRMAFAPSGGKRVAS